MRRIVLTELREQTPSKSFFEYDRSDKIEKRLTTNGHTPSQETDLATGWEGAAQSQPPVLLKQILRLVAEAF